MGASILDLFFHPESTLPLTTHAPCPWFLLYPKGSEVIGKTNQTKTKTRLALKQGGADQSLMLGSQKPQRLKLMSVSLLSAKEMPRAKQSPKGKKERQEDMDSSPFPHPPGFSRNFFTPYSFRRQSSSVRMFKRLHS